MASALLVRDLDEMPGRLRAGGAISVGNFDGVHRGHARIARRLVARARREEGPAIIFSFQPHPANVLRPDAAPTPLMWPERKAALLGQLGIDALIAYPTEPRILALSPTEFFRRIVVERFAARAMVEGPNFRFGRHRAGTIELLAQLCQAENIALEIVEPLLVDGQYVSSSRVRKLIAEGEVQVANQLLTAPHRIRGDVVVGACRGRTLGFPTANVEVTDLLVPAAGVYAGRAITSQGAHGAAIHVGSNPTFADATPKIEVHLLDFEGDLYGTSLEIEFLARVRGVQRFPDGAALARQLDQDIEAVRLIVGKHSAPSTL